MLNLRYLNSTVGSISVTPMAPSWCRLLST